MSNLCFCGRFFQSRCRVVVLHKLTELDLQAILKKALTDAEHGLGSFNVTADDKGKS
jgi:replication-associated recombination protein RarA